MVAATMLALACLIGSTAVGRPAVVEPLDPCEVSEQFSALDDHSFQGQGDKVVKLDLCPDLGYIALITHDGGSNFVVRELSATGDSGELLVNEIGNYEGVRLLSFGPPPTALEINAGGAWNVIVQTFDHAPTWDGVKAEGRSDAVLRIAPELLADLPVLKIGHNGDSNFVVRAHGKGSDLLVNEIGAYDGEVLLPSDTLLLEIIADGAWTVEAA